MTGERGEDMTGHLSRISDEGSCRGASSGRAAGAGASWLFAPAHSARRQSSPGRGDRCGIIRFGLTAVERVGERSDRTPEVPMLDLQETEEEVEDAVVVKRNA